MRPTTFDRTVRVSFAIALVTASVVNLVAAIGWLDFSHWPLALNVISPETIEALVVNTLGGILAGISLVWMTLGFNGLRQLKASVSRPTINLSPCRAPRNIFTGLHLGAPRKWVEEKLGAPAQIGKNWAGYIFSDALLSLNFTPDDALECISVAIINDKAVFDFPAIHFECPPLGKLRLSDVLKADHLEMRYDDSLRHQELLVTGREGPNGGWHYIAFGCLDPHAPGLLFPAEFSWDREGNKLLSPAQHLIVNWAAISSNPNIETFPWRLGLILTAT